MIHCVVLALGLLAIFDLSAAVPAHVWVQPTITLEEQAQAVLHRLRDSNSQISKGAKCKCHDSDLCEPVTVQHAKEVFGFIYPGSKNFRHYDWHRLTAVAWLEDNELICLAHSHNARVIYNAGDVSEAMANVPSRVAWVVATLRHVLDYSLDGVNFDNEHPMSPDSEEATAYTQLVALTRRALSLVVPTTQVSVDVPWSPYDVDNRNYDWVGLAEVADLLFVMAYDTQSQIWGRCVASANTPLALMTRGLRQWLMLGVPPDKLVVGLPWYGYDYPCVPDATGNQVALDVDVCLLAPVSFSGAPCSDAAGEQRSYADLMQMLRGGLNTTRVRWEPVTASVSFNYKHEDGSIHQVWFDDPATLEPKYAVAAALELRGVGSWNLEWLYTPVDRDAPKAAARDAAAMWQAIEDGFFGADDDGDDAAVPAPVKQQTSQSAIPRVSSTVTQPG